MNYLKLLILSFIFMSFVCKKNTETNSIDTSTNYQLDSSYKTIHILVALCDNQYQGIVPVPSKIGNGQDPKNNLYWGCGYGIKTYFKRSKEWTLVKTYKKDSIIIERAIFKHKTKKYILVADAYDGKFIKTTTIDFIKSCSGQKKDSIQYNNKIYGCNGNSEFISYIGHNGLMDFTLEDSVKNTDGKTRTCCILACISRDYFTNFIKMAKAKPVLWTTQLMCPEAYTIHDALSSWMNNGTDKNVQESAAKAYSKYHPSCSVNCAKRLLVTGF